MNIEALVISVDEPQLERCMESVRSQTTPFTNIIHINNIHPEYMAFNSGIERITCDAFMKIDGDMILNRDAVEFAMKSIVEMHPLTYCYNFMVYDTFFMTKLRGVGVMNTDITRRSPYRDTLDNDSIFGKRMAQLGFTKRNFNASIGTHFEGADEFQVFRRFYCQGVKHGGKYHLAALEKLYEDTKNPLYELAIRALNFGTSKRYYPTSHSVEFDRKMYEEFLNA